MLSYMENGHMTFKYLVKSIYNPRLLVIVITHNNVTP